MHVVSVVHPDGVGVLDLQVRPSGRRGERVVPRGIVQLGHVVASGLGHDPHVPVEVGTERIDGERVGVAGAAEAESVDRADLNRIQERPVDDNLEVVAVSAGSERVRQTVVALIARRGVVVGVEVRESLHH